jgi:hypothetical protein
LADHLGIPVWKPAIAVGQALDAIRISNSKRTEQKKKDKFRHQMNEALSRRGPQEYGAGMFLSETPL